MRIDDYGFLVDKSCYSYIEVEDYGLVYATDDQICCFEKNNELRPLESLLNKNLRSPSLGYVSIGKDQNDLYLTRIPGRFYRVGIYHRNTDPGYLLEGDYRDIGKMLLGVKNKKYPNFQKAWKTAKDTGKTKAFSKRYAVTPRTLQFRGASIGNIVRNTVEFHSQEEVDFHYFNLASLECDLRMVVTKNQKPKKELNPEEEDV